MSVDPMLQPLEGVGDSRAEGDAEFEFADDTLDLLDSREVLTESSAAASGFNKLFSSKTDFRLVVSVAVGDNDGLRFPD